MGIFIIFLMLVAGVAYYFWSKEQKKQKQQKASLVSKSRELLATCPQTFTETLPGGVTLEMVKIPAGSFLMGTDEAEVDKRFNQKLQEDLEFYTSIGNTQKCETPQHQVKLQEFYLGKYLITQDQYKAIMGENPSKYWCSNSKDKPYPVEKVSFSDAQLFCKKLSKITGKNYRLPTEAEWEYACRAGTTTSFYFGDSENELGEYAWCSQNATKAEYVELAKTLVRTHPVGLKKPNNWGLYDMHGNLFEMCEDDWHSSYINKPENLKQNGNITWLDDNKPSNERTYTLRSSNWSCNADASRSAVREESKGGGNYATGFRVCIFPQPQQNNQQLIATEASSKSQPQLNTSKDELKSKSQSQSNFSKNNTEHDQNAEYWFNQGVELGDDTRTQEEAIIALKKAIEIEPNYVEAWLNLGDIFKYFHRDEEAKLAYTKVVEIQATNAEGWFKLGKVLYKLEEDRKEQENDRRNPEILEKVLDYYHKAIEIQPNNSKAWSSCGRVLIDLGVWSEGIFYYDKAIELDPEDFSAKMARDAYVKLFSDILCKRGNELITVGETVEEYQKAISCYDEVIEFNSDYFEAWFSRGIALGVLGRDEEAILSYKKAIEIQSEHFGPWNLLGDKLCKLGRYQEAINCFDKAINIGSDDEEFLSSAWGGRGFSLLGLLKIKEAMQSFNKAIEIDPNNAKALKGRDMMIAQLNIEE
jgi:formylglycine-generating enzyme required for sulfatase activity/Tfp pilus assembly protein PilF